MLDRTSVGGDTFSMMRLLPFLLPFLLAVAATPAAAQGVPEWNPNDVEVDMELLLLVDVSRSMAPRELEIQRRGYAEALTSDAVLNVIGDGFLGHIAVSYVEWAGVYSQRTVVDWTIIGSLGDAQDFARTLTTHSGTGMRRTSISGALRAGADLFDGNGYQGLRRVIDISGDGPNNEGSPVSMARDEVVARGITVNGLPLMTQDGMGGQWHLEDLDQYYANCVIGGPGSFMIPVTDWDEFAAAVRRKLVLEIAGRMPPVPEFPRPTGPDRVIPTQGAAAYDCLVGEKIWQRYRDSWEP